MQYSYADRNGVKEKPQRHGVFVSAAMPGATPRTTVNRIQLNRIALDASRMKAHPKQMKFYAARMKLESRQVKLHLRQMQFNPAWMKLHPRQMKLDLRRMKASGPRPGGVL